jgi:hypothetical protein
MYEKKRFWIEQNCGCTKIVNNTKKFLEVNTVPIKPKRKSWTILIIAPLSFQLFEGIQIDKKRISFRIVSKKEIISKRVKK